ncbi:unnamed protein product [Acanthoscelides obtectus]|uniref:Thioredoxin domain-containing protein 9 n=1 Tax=Acanthoscelides obtectus TaxID=200917 RepID=A0A9P0NQ90_ACAOB|nr:unnamed protein product [Acanthoscelides obtectus]CAK1678747.1 Thioredoxin domain-containing protein 9 [Acanthoscelides obtectus]
MTTAEENLIQVTRAIEKQVDSVLEQLDNLKTEDLAQIRQSRIKELQKQEEQKKVWLSNDHGKYEELAEEKMFFDVIKNSENVVLHFYTESNERCKILDKHLKLLAPKHIETRFAKLNAEKCPFLTEKLKIKVIPTLVLIHNGIMVDKIIGFTQLGNRDDFSTETLEWRIAQNEIINYEGDLSTPPDEREHVKQKSGKKIREGIFNSTEDDDLDIEEYAIKRDNVPSGQKENFGELTAEEKAELGLD